MSNFKVGEKVVCINVEKQKYGGLILNEIYEVIGIHPIHDAILVNGFDYSHWSKRFRKLDHQFAEDLCKELAKQVQTENYQLC